MPQHNAFDESYLTRSGMQNVIREVKQPANFTVVGCLACQRPKMCLETWAAGWATVPMPLLPLSHPVNCSAVQSEELHAESLMDVKSHQLFDYFPGLLFPPLGITGSGAAWLLQQWFKYKWLVVPSFSRKPISKSLSRAYNVILSNALRDMLLSCTFPFLNMWKANNNPFHTNV